MIIDCHGHYTTAPKALDNWRNQQIAGIKDPPAMPKVSGLKISDDEIREYLSGNLCRCAGYADILRAVRRARERIAPAPSQPK